MAQQINLCTVIVAKQRKSFSARTMAMGLSAFTLVGGILCAAWVWNLRGASAGYTETLAAQTRDIQALKTALSEARASAAPLDAALQQQLQNKRAQLAQKEQLLTSVRQGLLEPGMGHSDRMELIARTIPPQAWVTTMRADSVRLELSGFTLDTAALNDWVGRLSGSPLTRGLRLSNVQVENVAQARNSVPGTGVTPTVPGAPAQGAAQGTAQAASAQRPSWAFHLVSTTPPGPADVRPGGKP